MGCVHTGKTCEYVTVQVQPSKETRKCEEQLAASLPRLMISQRGRQLKKEYGVSPSCSDKPVWQPVGYKIFETIDHGRSIADSKMSAVSEHSVSFSRIASLNSCLQYKEPNQTILIFDWDDTLLPSSWMRGHLSVDKQGFTLTNVGQQACEELEVLASRVVEILNVARTLGKVVLVTNARRPWVDQSCLHLIPSVMDTLQDIPVIYALEHMGAKERFGQSRADLLTEAKARAMKSVVSEFYSRYDGQSWKNVVTVGDASFEHIAIRRVTNEQLSGRLQNSKKCRTKTIKMIEGPSVSGLSLQLAVLSSWLAKIVTADHDIDIDLSDDPEKVEAWYARYGDYVPDKGLKDSGYAPDEYCDYVPDKGLNDSGYVPNEGLTLSL